MIGRYLNTRVDRFSAPVTRDYEDKVQNGLAITPSQMQDMAQRGIPVSTSNLGLGYEDGYSELDFTPPSEHLRGIDMADLWEQRQSIKKKLRTGVAKAKAEGLINVSAE